MQVFKIPESMKKGFKYTFCPGCDHGIAIRLIAELLDEMGLQEKTICATSIGCSVFLYDFLNIDCIEAPHGRAMAEATGVKRARPDKFVFTYHEISSNHEKKSHANSSSRKKKRRYKFI